nr:hypothetical protein [Tanacetum cinerariifolium]
MSDSEDSTITYTAVSSPFGGFSDIGSPRVDGPLVMPEDPYAYVVAAFQAPPFPDYVLEDDILRAEEQPLPAATSPTTESSGYIDESDPNEDPPEEDPKDDPEEDPADYLADGGDEAVDHVPYAEETEPFKTDESAATPSPHPTYRVTARILMAIPTPPSPLSPLSLPLPQIPSPPLPLLSPPPTNTTYEEAPLCYRAARLRWRAKIEEILETDLPLRKRLCTAHTGTYELGESSATAAARLRELVRDDLYKFVDTVERGEGSTPAAMVAQSMDASDAARSGVIALRTRVSAPRTEIIDLRAADRIFQTTVGTQQEEIKELQAADRKLQA